MAARPLSPEELLAHVDWMRRLAGALVHDAEEAKDLAQEGVRAALARPPLADRPVRPWLAGVLRNLARLRARGRGRQGRREAAEAVRLDQRESPTPEALIARVQTERQVTELVLSLDEPFRSTLLLRYYEGRTAAEIARAQQIPAGTVRWRIKQGLDRIRTELDRKDARRWRALLAPIALHRPEAPLGAGTPTLLEGVALMSAKTKVAAAIGLLIALLVAVRLGRGPAPDHLTKAPSPLGIDVSPRNLRATTGPGGIRVATTVDPEPAGVLRLQGQVIDPEEAPIEGAVVAIDSNPPRMATTDANGVFAFPGLRQRTYSLEAQGRDLYAGPVETMVSTIGEPVVLRARPAQQLEVTVIDGRAAANPPLPGARIELRSTLVWRAETDARGVAALPGVGPGFRALRVEKPGFAPAAQMVATEAADKNRPGVQRLRVILEGGFAVSGRVLGPDGRAVAGARIWARDASEPFPVVDPAFDAVSSDDAGRWRIDALVSGSYQFLAAHPEYAQSSTAPVVVGRAAVEGVEVRLEGGGRLTGQVRSDEGRPVAGAQVRAAALAGMALWPDLRETFSDEAGNFALSALPRRPIQVMALHDGAASEMVGVDLAAERQANLRLTLTVRAGIEGVVVDGRGQPLAEAQVTARAEELFKAGPIKAARMTPWDLRGIPMFVTDASGRFHFGGLPDGQYTVRAARPGAHPRQSALQPGTNARAGDKNVRVVVRGDGRLIGRVQFEDGKPVTVFTIGLGPTPPTPIHDPGGAFWVAAPAGIHRLKITGPAFVTRRIDDVSIEEEGSKDLGTITVQRGRSIAGRVLFADGRPVPNADVVAGLHISGGGNKLYIADESLGGQETTTDDDGLFLLQGFEAGRPLVVIAERAGQGRSSSMAVPAALGNVQLDLTLRPTGSLAGVITRDGRPFPETVVIVSPQLGTSNFFVMSGPDGRFALDTLASGPQLLIGFLNRQKDMLIHPVEIRIGKRTEADLDVRSGRIELTVRVRSDAGGPVPGARVLLVSDTFQPSPEDTGEDFNQRFRPTRPTTLHLRDTRDTVAIPGLLAGTYTACATPLAPEAMKRGSGAKLSGALRCTTRPVTASGEMVVTLPSPP